MTIPSGADLFSGHWSKTPVKRVPPTERYKTAEALQQGVIDYFNWMNDTPLEAEKVFSTKNGTERATVNHVRSPSIRAMCLHLQIDTNTWRSWREQHPLYRDVCLWAEDVLYAVKFEAASVDLINPMLAVRDLGLRDGHELSGPGGGPIETEVSPKDVILGKLARISAALGADDDAGEPDGSAG